ncbi:MAG: hypothetical protein KHZ82_01695 [Peptoniphilus harei]|nr:hypothetical protein [Peptoniphilus harei]
MMNSYKVKSNPLMASSNYEKINSHILSSKKDKISFPITKAYRDKVNTFIFNDFKIYEGKALMINCQMASERRCCSYD